MEEFKKSKEVTIIFVSHSLGQIEKFCTRTIYLKNHQVQCDSKPKEAIDKYINDIKKNESL
jgi:ABC-type polysaccharide/polyol phosphate transport system ATPase subunit